MWNTKFPNTLNNAGDSELYGGYTTHSTNQAVLPPVHTLSRPLFHNPLNFSTYASTNLSTFLLKYTARQIHTPFIPARWNLIYIYGKNICKQLHEVLPNISSLPDHRLWRIISLPQPSRFYPRPSSRDIFKTISSTGSLEIKFGIYVNKIYGFISVKKFAIFGYIAGVSFPRKLKLNNREF